MFGQSLLSGAFGGAACTTDTDQLFATDVTATTTATYQLNGVTTSIPSNTYPGTANNITYAAGKFDNAAVFNGSSSYIALPTGQFNYSNFTISSWVYPTSAPPSVRGTILSTYMYTAGPSKGYLFGINADMTVHFSCYYDDSGNRVSADTTQTVPFNQWTQLSVSFSTVDSKVIFYINGVSVKTVNFSGNVLRYENNNNTSIGALKYNSSTIEQYFLGRIDQVRIFNTALPQAAVTALYNETVATSSSASINYVNSNPNSIAYYKMSDATDQLGSYNGTATNVNFNTEGKFGFAGAFNGSSSSFSFSNSAYGSSTTVFTASGWFKHTSSANNREDIYFGNGATVGGSSGYAIYTDYSTGNIGLSFRTNPNQVFYNSSTNIKDGNWHHVCLTYNNGVYVLYVDNVSILNGTSSYYLNNLTPSKDTFVGSRYGTTGAGTSIIGAVDQVRIYNSVASAAQVNTLYKEIECPAATVINSFNTVIYTGNGSSQNLNIGFNADLTWIKSRTQTYGDNSLVDTLRGAYNLTTNKSAAQEATNGGIVINNNNTVTAAVVSGNLAGETNESGENYVSFNWKGGGTAVSNTDGTIASSVSANKEAGFSVVKYTGTGSTATVGHGLGKPAELILVKVTSASASWAVYSEPTGISKYLELNGQGGTSNYSNYWGSVAPTNSVFGVVNGNFNNNSSGATLIAYCFASIPGYSKVGSYLGIGGTTGNVVYVGFEPSFILIKDSTNSGNWALINNKTAPTNPRKTWIRPNLNLAEFTNSVDSMNFSSTGFQVSGTATSDFINRSGATFIFLAIA